MVLGVVGSDGQKCPIVFAGAKRTTGMSSVHELTTRCTYLSEPHGKRYRHSSDELGGTEEDAAASPAHPQPARLKRVERFLLVEIQVIP